MDILDLALNSISFLTLREKFLLKKNIDSLDKLVVLSIEDICSIVNRTVKSREWNPRDLMVHVTRAAKVMEIQDINGAVYGTPEYPVLLSQINDAPYMIFYRGKSDAWEKKCVSIVGTRRVCGETAQSAFDFARDAAMDHGCVVSGLANGIDTFAHKGALSSGEESCTIAVLPCGIDSIVPAGNKKLAEKIILSGGVILSEFMPGTPSESWRFVQRNRIIAGLSRATVLIQAPCGSGALITADFALDYNRDVIFHKSGFCNAALKIDSVLQSQYRANSAVNKTRLERSSQKYLQDGAPIIGDYPEYVRVLQSAPGEGCEGERFIKERQLELFQ